MLGPVVAPVAALLLIVSAPARAAAGRGQATRSVVYARHGMVCAAQPLAAQAGRRSRSTPASA
jgi:gamma-glutamyltranspeptidase